MSENTIFRSGELALVRTLDSIGNPRTIINFEIAPDEQRLGDVSLIHLPIPDRADVYDLGSEGTRRWIESALDALSEPQLQLPVLVHCTAGKDRTGVVVAALLAALRIPREVIIEEYTLSEGPLYEDLLGTMIDSMTCDEFFGPEVVQGLRRHYTEPEQDAPDRPLNAAAVL